MFSKILYLFATLFFLSSLLFNELFLRIFDPSPPISDRVVNQIRESQMILIAISFSFLLIGVFVSKTKKIKSILNNNISINITLFIITIISPLSLIEISGRAFEKQSDLLFIEDKILDYKLKPNFSGMYSGMQVKINSEGMRGDEQNYNDEENKILIVGDSVSFGFGVELQDTYSYKIQEYINTFYKNKTAILNSSVPGYDISQYRKYLEINVEKIRPNLILLCITLNDINEFQGTGSESPVKFTKGIRFWLEKSQQVLGISNSKISMRKAQELTVNQINFYEKENNEALDLFFSEIEKIRDISIRNNVPLNIIIHPYSYQFDKNEKEIYPQSEITKKSRELNIESVDLLPKMKKKSLELEIDFSEFYLPNDFNHFSIIGHDIVYEIIKKFLIEKIYLQ